MVCLFRNLSIVYQSLALAPNDLPARATKRHGGNARSSIETSRPHAQYSNTACTGWASCLQKLSSVPVSNRANSPQGVSFDHWNGRSQDELAEKVGVGVGLGVGARVGILSVGAGVGTTLGTPSVGADDDEVSSGLKKVGAAVPAVGENVLGLAASGIEHRERERERDVAKMGCASCALVRNLTDLWHTHHGRRRSCKRVGSDGTPFIQP